MVPAVSATIVMRPPLSAMTSAITGRSESLFVQDRSQRRASPRGVYGIRPNDSPGSQVVPHGHQGSHDPSASRR